MKRGILPFAELFILLAVVFLIQLAATAALNRSGMALPSERLYTVEIRSPDGGPIVALRYVEIQAKTGRFAAVWRPDQGCTRKAIVSTKTFRPSDIKSQRLNGQCTSVEFESANYSIYHPIRWKQILDDFNRDINYRGTKREETSVTLTALYENRKASPPQIAYRPIDVREPITLNIGFCEGEKAGEPALELVFSEISSGKVPRVSKVVYEWDKQKAWFGLSDSRQTEIYTAYRMENCQTESIADTVGIARVNLLPTGPSLFGAQ